MQDEGVNMEDRPDPTQAAEDYRGYPEQGNYFIKEAVQTGGRLMHRPRLQRLKDAKKGLESKLAEVNHAIKLLEDNPQMNELMEAIERAGV